MPDADAMKAGKSIAHGSVPEMKDVQRQQGSMKAPVGIMYHNTSKSIEEKVSIQKSTPRLRKGTK